MLQGASSANFRNNIFLCKKDIFPSYLSAARMRQLIHGLGQCRAQCADVAAQETSATHTREANRKICIQQRSIR